MTKLNQKTEDAKKAADFFKGMLASYFGVQPEDISLDATVKNVPPAYMDLLEKDGCEIKIIDAGLSVTRSTFIEEEDQTLIHFYGEKKSLFMDKIYEICKPKPDPSYDREEEAFERMRDDINPIFNDVLKSINPNH